MTNFDTVPAPIAIEQVFFLFAVFCVVACLFTMFVWLPVARWLDARATAAPRVDKAEERYNKQREQAKANPAPAAPRLRDVAFDGADNYPTAEWDVTRKKEDATKVLTLSPSDRGFTLFAAKSKHGKTTAQIQLMLADIKSGARVYWLSTHSTLYNVEDQPVDLRPLVEAGKLVRKREVADIVEVITKICRTELQARRDWYDETPEKLKAAPTYVLHIGEWPELYAELSRNGDKRGNEIAGYIANVLRAGRKYRIFLSLDMQDGRAKHGLDTSDLSMFWTKIVGDIDPVSWRNIGMSGAHESMPRREWIVSAFDADGNTTRTRGALGIATSEQAAALVGGVQANKPSTKAKPVEDELTPVREWLTNEPDIAGREVARRIYRLRNGLAPDAPIEYLGDGDLYYVARGLLEDAKKL